MNRVQGFISFERMNFYPEVFFSQTRVTQNSFHSLGKNRFDRLWFLRMNLFGEQPNNRKKSNCENYFYFGYRFNHQKILTPNL